MFTWFADKKEKGMPLLVAALDVGTSYSGYAYAFIDDSNTAPQKIFTHQHLNLSGNLTSKIPTCLLLNKKKEFVSFGYDAEKDYGDIMIDNEQANFYFFSRFKMILHEKVSSNFIFHFKTHDLHIDDYIDKIVKDAIVMMWYADANCLHRPRHASGYGVFLLF